MAQRAESLKIEESGLRSAPLVPMPVRKEPGPAPERTVKEEAAARYEEIVQRSRELGANIRRRWERTREDRPLLIVGVAAGIAFALGIMLRIWRSRNE